MTSHLLPLFSWVSQQVTAHCSLMMWPGPRLSEDWPLALAALMSACAVAGVVAAVDPRLCSLTTDGASCRDITGSHDDSLHLITRLQIWSCSHWPVDTMCVSGVSSCLMPGLLGSWAAHYHRNITRTLHSDPDWPTTSQAAPLLPITQHTCDVLLNTTVSSNDEFLLKY